MNSRRRWAVLASIVLLALLLRGWAVMRLPTDFDEPTYLEAAFHYADALRAGDWNAVIDYQENREHPALVKLLYGLVVLALGEEPGTVVAQLASRALSALLGTLAVLVLAILDPLAGGLLAVHTLAVKYTSQVYLEALPHLASIGAVLAFSRVPSGRDRATNSRPVAGRPMAGLAFWLSALALGVTAAGKLTYLPVILPILYLAIWEKRLRWHDLLLYGAAAVAVFWLLNPTLWHNPLGRLADSLFFHLRYSQGARVEAAGYPWYQPLYWLSHSGPSVWHPEVFFYFALDGPIFLLALPGLYWEWRERRWVVVWIVTSVVVLLLWPTKWPQYTLVVTPALCLAASSAVRHLYRALRQHEDYWAWARQMIPVPPLSFWVMLAALGLLVVAIYTSTTMELTLGRIGWSHLRTETSLLPSDTVYAIVPQPGDGAAQGMVLGTGRGAAIWSPRETTDLPDRWLVYTPENSGLPHSRVLAIARSGPDLWFGTEGGLARLSGDEWQSFGADDLGLAAAPVYALAVGSDGRLWVGTGAGAAVYDGQTWTPYTAARSGLDDDGVLSLAIQTRGGERSSDSTQSDGDLIWFGTRRGVSWLDTETGGWLSFAGDFDPSWGGVPALLVDSAGRLWAGTIGGGLGLWDGTAWQFYRTSNADIPFNTVQSLAEVEPGVLWIGVAPPTEVGGVLAEFDGQAWKEYTPRNSGFSGAEPLTIAQDAEGRWWIGTRTAGVDVYQPER
jgi:hypothetical protein